MNDAAWDMSVSKDSYFLRNFSDFSANFGVSGFWRESISCVSFNFRVSLLTQLLTAYQLIHLLIN